MIDTLLTIGSQSVESQSFLVCVNLQNESFPELSPLRRLNLALEDQVRTLCQYSFYNRATLRSRLRPAGVSVLASYVISISRIYFLIHAG